MTPAEQHQALRAIIYNSPWFMRALHAVNELALESWCIGAGAVRNLVWDSLHGSPKPSALSDVDVAYFAESAPQSNDKELQAKLVRLCAEFPWEVTNQAHVHQWYAAYYGYSVEPLKSLTEAVSTWPEFCTSVGVYLAANNEIKIIAPHGLDDLFGLVVRRNPARVSIETYAQRCTQKNYPQRWPNVQVIRAVLPN